MQDSYEKRDRPFNGKQRRSVCAPAVRPQEIEKIGELVHGDALEGLDVAKVVPVLGPAATSSPAHVDVPVGQREARCQHLQEVSLGNCHGAKWGRDEGSILTMASAG